MDEVGLRLARHLLHARLPRADRRVRDDRVEEQALDGAEELPRARPCVEQGVELDVLPRQGHGALVHVGEDGAALRGEGRRHDPQDPVAAAEVQGEGAWRDLQGLREEEGARVRSALREDAGIGQEVEEPAADLRGHFADLVGAPGGAGEVLLGHARELRTRGYKMMSTETRRKGMPRKPFRGEVIRPPWSGWWRWSGRATSSSPPWR